MPDSSPRNHSKPSSSSSPKRRHRDHDDDDHERNREDDRHHRSKHRHRHHDGHDSDDDPSTRTSSRRTRRSASPSNTERHRHSSKDRHHNSSTNERSSHKRSSHHSSSSKRRETSQERRERKALKKASKKKSHDHHGDYELVEEDHDQAAALRSQAADLLMYSAEDNPFNDANLGQKFKWGKKEEKERKQGLSRKEAERRDAIRREEAKAELEKLNAKRAEREREAALREEEESRMARLAESAQMAEWVAKEDDFHLEQAKRRANIRVRENRAKPIDLLSINLKWADPLRIKPSHLAGQDGMDDQERNDEEEEEEDDEAGLEIDLEEPYNIFDNLTLEETEELHQDIQMYLTLEKKESNLDFWRSMIVVCDDKLSELRSQRGDSRGDPRQQQQQQQHSRIDPAVKAETNAMLSTKTHDQLIQLQEQVRSKLTSGEPVDVEYWESLLKSIVVWKAKAKLRDMHEVVLSNRIEYLQRKQRDEALRHQADLLNQMGGGEERHVDRAAALEPTDEDRDAAAEEDERLEKEMESLWDESEMEPTPLDKSKMNYEDRRLPVVTLQEDREQLVSARRSVLGVAFVPRTKSGSNNKDDDTSLPGHGGDASTSLYRQEASKALDVEEETFNKDENLARQTYKWEDKYRPRKPRYFNRVHTGYEWNKYNQTHYDTDNPPPKVVQGYKFNIFYPDLIDKSSAPTYRIIKEPGNRDTVLLRFSAGPPYEDIAFRIVNKEWEYSHRRGFRSSFDRGVLQLYFNFKRLHYRK
ncbi:hypothetical protein IE53DRAFT_378939 [Violaceomyces palustris]|uniref:Uncharacterized protein n=1 Tax=Violaceomyces palustris TaxID=1673888 RepID=A0ACD0P027_9BASI|nr:hypothetical protein IE53DRAFT_378939 [Violaceomyces palustris]